MEVMHTMPSEHEHKRCDENWLDHFPEEKPISLIIEIMFLYK